jgi:hypothetical protein
MIAAIIIILSIIVFVAYKVEKEKQTMDLVQKRIRIVVAVVQVLPVAVPPIILILLR